MKRKYQVKWKLKTGKCNIIDVKEESKSRKRIIINQNMVAIKEREAAVQ